MTKPRDWPSCLWIGHEKLAPALQSLESKSKKKTLRQWQCLRNTTTTLALLNSTEYLAHDTDVQWYKYKYNGTTTSNYPSSSPTLVSAPPYHTHTRSKDRNWSPNPLAAQLMSSICPVDLPADSTAAACKPWSAFLAYG